MTESPAQSVLCADSMVSCGKLSLFVRSVVPERPAWARLGLLHGYGDHCGRHEHVLQWMAQRGVACYAMDFRGHGRSSGRRGFVRAWDDFLEDLRAFLSQDSIANQGGPPLFLLGHSHGGLVLAAAAIVGLPNVRGVIFTSPYFRNLVPVPWYKTLLGHIANRLFPSMQVRSGMRREWLSADPAMLTNRDQDPFALNFATPRWFITMQSAQRDVLAHAADFRMPSLMLLGSADPIADPAAGRLFHDRAGAVDKTLKVYPGLLHEILRETSREAVLADIIEWMRQR